MSIEIADDYESPAGTFTLTAKQDGVRKRTVRFYAVNSMDATTSAINEILKRAYRDTDGPWGKGAIKLYDPTGVVIHEMEAK